MKDKQYIEAIEKSKRFIEGYPEAWEGCRR